MPGPNRHFWPNRVFPAYAANLASWCDFGRAA